MVLDPSPAKHDFPFYSLGKIEILTPNEKDIFTYTGIRMLSAEDMLRASIILSTKIDAKYIAELKWLREKIYQERDKLYPDRLEHNLLNETYALFGLNDTLLHHYDDFCYIF